MNRIKTILYILLSSCLFILNAQDCNKYVRISKEYSHYYELENGKTWIPIMTNYLTPNDDFNGTDDNEFNIVEDYFRKFSDNGGNAMRIWISASFLEIEDKLEGEYNPVKFARIDRLLALAGKYGIRVKFTLQHIRFISSTSTPSTGWATSKALASAFTDMEEYITTARGRQSYLNRVKAFSDRYKNNKQIYGWELWNEMNAAGWKNDSWYDFTTEVLPKVKALFPNQMVTQTLGSLDSKEAEKSYKMLFAIESNEYISIHRYLDQGNKAYETVKGTVDTLVSSAMNFTLKNVKDKPIVINEIGAVEGNHAGPFKLYKKDRDGVLIHDMIFAPFFCGAAGSGGMWHWDHYIYPQNLWYHFKRFSKAVENCDPVKEHFQHFFFETNGVRCYGLKGISKTIMWCRDGENNWKTELEKNITARSRSFSFNLNELANDKYSTVVFYDPWKDARVEKTVKKGKINVPYFKRSIVIILEK